MNFISSESISFDRVQIMSWESFLPKTIHERSFQQDLNSSSTSITSLPFVYDPCQVTTYNLPFYINPHRRPDIV
jgi:hypothetical protein